MHARTQSPCSTADPHTHGTQFRHKYVYDQWVLETPTFQVEKYVFVHLAPLQSKMLVSHIWLPRSSKSKAGHNQSIKKRNMLMHFTRVKREKA